MLHSRWKTVCPCYYRDLATVYLCLAHHDRLWNSTVSTGSDDEYRRRTAITRLALFAADEQLLQQTVAEYKHGCQRAVDMAREWCRSKSDIQQLAYDDVLECTELGSQHAILACHQAAENIKSCIERRQNGKKVSKPTYTAPTVTYDSRTMIVFADKEQVSLTTRGDHPRVRADLVLPE